MELFVWLIALLALLVLDVLAGRFGADSRPGVRPDHAGLRFAW